MSNFVRRSIGLLLALVMIAAQILVGIPAQVNAADISAQASTGKELTQYIQDGATLQCWNWSFNNIKANMGLIANLGYSAIQVSPPQEGKEGTVNKPFENWWVLYQPISFNLNQNENNAIGTRDEFIALCNEAHKYGIRVIVDVISNHLADDGTDKIEPSPLIPSDILNDRSCWHNEYNIKEADYRNRYDITQRAMSLPDLNTGNKKIQNYVLNYLKDCIDCGADGFRFDAAKQIETPDDYYTYASDFWPTVINGANEYAASTRGIMLYSYGEMLQNPDESGSLPVSAYTKYMSVTENAWSNDIRQGIESGNFGKIQFSYFKQCAADKLVLWAESHDTFWDGYSAEKNGWYTGPNETRSHRVSTHVLNRTYALITARQYAMSLYFARSNDMLYQEMGDLAKTGWSNPEVKAVNWFNNAMVGKAENTQKYTDYNGNTFAYIHRGDAGVVIINLSGGNVWASVPNRGMKTGTYKDQVTGNEFTVSADGWIYGQMGDSGVAVIYNAATVSCSHPSHGSDGYCYDCYEYVGHKSGNTCSVCGTASTKTLYFKNTKGWNNVYIYGWHDSSDTSVTSAWPGNKMTKVEGDIYKATVPASVSNVIFNNGNGGDGNQTFNLTPSVEGDTYDASTGYWTKQGEVFFADNYMLFGFINGQDYNGSDYIFKDGKLTTSFTQDSYVFICDSNGIEYMTEGAMGDATSATLKPVGSIASGHDKLKVPGGVQVTLSLTPNADGTITLSYTTDGQVTPDPTPDPNPTTTTIYFDNSGKNWSKVNVYAWGDNEVKYTGEWPGSAMTKVSGSIYSFEVPTGATKIIFNDGKNQTDDLSIPTDGKNQFSSATNSWSVYSAGGSVNPGNPGTTTGDYYLFGYINGADYNEYDYKFVNGKLTVTFTQDSYVFICDGKGIEYMTEGAMGNATSATLKPVASIASGHDKLKVPGNKQVTLSLTVNANGTLTLSYTTGGQVTPDPTPDPNPTTTTIYFDNSGSKWSKVNVYAWGDNEVKYTGEWPGSAMTKVSDNIYSFEVPTGATKIIFNDGKNQTDDLTIPTDGKNQFSSATNSWSVYSAGGSDNPGNPGTTTGDYYLFGYINGADYNDYDYKFVNGKLTVTFTQDSYVFICDGKGIEYMTEGAMGNATSATLKPVASIASGHDKLKVPGNKQVTLSLTVNANGTLTLSYTTGGQVTPDPTPDPNPTTTTIYFDNSGSKWSKVNVYAWDDNEVKYTGEWPGTAMTKVSGDIYSFEVPSSATKIIFNDGKNQTDDLTIPTDGKNQFSSATNAWSVYSDGTECDHNYVEKITPPTCEGEGLEVYTCSKCGDQFSVVIGPAGHSYKSNVTTAATCTKAGVMTYTCSECGDSYTEIIPATGHKYSNGICTVCGVKDPNCNHSYTSKVTVAPTCLDTGVMTYTCSKCGDVYTEVIKANGHKYIKTIVPPTCENNGYTINSCENCTYHYNTDPVNPIGHNYSEVVTAPTCTEKGYTTYTCSNCNNVYTWNETPATGHNFSGGICTVCRTPDPSYGVNEWYLFGLVNGTNYGEYDDAASSGFLRLYPTGDHNSFGKTFTLTEDSYIAVKNGNNTRWFMTDGWQGTDVTSVTLYDTTTLGEDADKLFVPAGKVTVTLVVNDNGTMTLSYVVQQTGVCEHPSHDINGFCTVCHYTVEHTYVGGICSVCGAADPNYDVPTTDYYLIGYINGANYGCDEDHENLGQYKFVNGKLTAKFDIDSYVFVKTGDNANWYMTNAYVSDTTGTFYNTNTGSSEKMLVPGGVEVTFTLVENSDGSLTLSYVTGGQVTPDPVGPAYYLAGTMNGWNEKDADYLLQKNGNVYKISVALTAGDYEFKITDGTWDNAWPGENYKLSIPADSNVTITFNPATGEITVDGIQDKPIEDSKDIKWQVTNGTNANSASTNLRVLTWVDNLENYSSVTFNITINGKTTKLECTTVYTAILASGVAIRNPANVFKNPDAKYFATYTLKNIPNSAFDTPIVVTVTWTDLQGNQTTSESKTIVISSDWT